MAKKSRKKSVAVGPVGTPNGKIVLPRTDPNLSNHTRMLMRKQYRGEGLPKELPNG